MDGDLMPHYCARSGCLRLAVVGDPYCAPHRGAITRRQRKPSKTPALAAPGLLEVMQQEEIRQAVIRETRREVYAEVRAKMIVTLCAQPDIYIAWNALSLWVDEQASL